MHMHFAPFDQSSTRSGEDLANNLFQLINEPTRITVTSSTIILRLANVRIVTIVLLLVNLICICLSP